MDDLISRKALLEAIDSSFIIPILKINMREEYKAVLRIREIIANMQTAFDKEKVINELREELNLSDAEKIDAPEKIHFNLILQKVMRME